MDTVFGEQSGYRVHGGAAGTMVEFEELEEQASRVEAAAQRLNDVFWGLKRIQQQDAWLSGLRPEAAAAITELATAADGVAGCADTAAATAGKLQSAAARYREAEGRVERMFSPAPAGAVTFGLLRFRAGSAAFPGRNDVDRLPLRFFDTAAIRTLMGFAGAGGGLVLRDLAVSRLERSGSQVEVAGTAAGLLERSAVLLEENDPGVVEILRLDGAGGPVFVVTIPGTQPGGGAMVGPNPFDNYGNAEGRAYNSRYVAAAVAEALRQAEAGAGDAVILVGYSQGGIHAANTAGQLEADLGVEVRYVLTAGAPAGDAVLPGGTEALHLEHQEDWVPGVDGTSNPDTANRITMTLTDPVPGIQGEDAGLGPAHKLPVYLDGAAAADASSDPSLRASLGGLGALVGAGGTATRELYRFSRKVPPPAEREPVRVVPPGPPPLAQPMRPDPGPALVPSVRRPLPFGPQRVSVIGPP